MRIRMMAAAAGMAVAAMSFAAPSYAEGTRLFSSCTGKAALGAGAGALLGNLVASHGQKTEGTMLGAAVGGLGTFGVCRYLTTRSEARIERGYRAAAASGEPYSTSWQGQGGTQSLYVSRPVRDGEHCKRLNATLTVPGGGQQSLPEETYCRGSKGVWSPAG